MKLIITFVFLLLGFCFSAQAQEARFDRYGGWTGLQGEKTGWFHAQEIGGRWWIITPEGNVFWSTGMYCVRFGGLPETGTGKRAYRDAVSRKYGSEREWARITRARLQGWGFNTIGDWSSESIYREPGLAYVIGIDLPRSAPNVIPQGYYGYFPDVFSDEFRASVRQNMEKRFKQQPYLTEDKWLLGYFLADEPAWYGSRQRLGALVDDFIALSAETPGKQAWVEFLKDKYSDIRELNKAWAKSYRSFNELLGLKRIEGNDNLQKDKSDFLREIARQFSRVLTQTLREFDSNHMVLGTRPTRLYPEVLQGIAEYIDVFSMSSYGLNQGYSINPDYEKTISEVYDNVNAPILLGVLIAGQDTGLPFGIVRTQQDRGISYWRYLSIIARDPRVVGVHWFQYFDPPAKCYDSQAANWGIVNDRDEEYTAAVELIAEANKMVYAYALGLSSFMPEFEGMGAKIAQASKGIDDSKLQKIQIPLLNKDFAQGRRHWGLQVWRGTGRVSIDSRVSYAGSNSLKIEGGEGAGWESVGVGIQGNTGFLLKPGHRYRLSARIKTQGVDDTAFVRIKVKYRTGEEGYFGTPAVYGTKDWALIEVEFTPRDENKVEYLGAQLVGKGIAWFDDINLEVYAPDNYSQEDFLAGKVKEEVVVRELAEKIEILNPGFEDGESGWSFQAWQGKPSVEIERRSARSGKNSLRISGAGSGWESVGVGVSELKEIVFDAYKTYRLSGWVKTKDVNDSAFIRIKVKYAGGRDGYFQTDSLDGTGDWEEVGVEFTPSESSRLEYLACQLVGAGTAWFDDISLGLYENKE